MFERLDERCARLVVSGAAPSISVAVMRGDDVAYARAWGVADPVAGRRATPDTAYLLASVTKPMTATAVCALADQGRLSLDDPVSTHLPWARFTRRTGGDDPSVRQLLSHTAGLGLHLEFGYPDDDRAMPDAAETVARFGNLFWPAGTRFAYTNLGYGVLDALLTQVGGPDAVAEWVFAPMGLDSARLGPRYPGPAPHAVPQTVSGAAYPPYDSTHRGASLGWASATDLARFGQSLAGRGSVLTDETVTAMCTPILDGAGYGLGVRLGEVGGYRTLGHGGLMGGVSTALLVMPELDLSLAVLVNRMGSLAPDVLDALLVELVPDAQTTPSGAATVARSPGLRGTRWRGQVHLPDEPVRIEIDVDDAGAVTVTIGDGPAQPASVEPSYYVDPSADLPVRLPAPLPTAEARARSPRSYLVLERAGDSLTGAARAEPLPDDATGWFGNCYSYWCELRLGGA